MKIVGPIGRVAVLLTAFAVAGAALAQDPDLRLPISVDADTTNYDGRNSMLMFSGLRLTQGSIGVEADEGRASNLDFADSVWEFTGNVVIDVENGHIECDAAHLQFSDHQLQHATITGSPATFEMRRQGSNDVTYAEAGRLDYDFAAGVVEFSEDAVISEGGNRISSNYLVYNIEEQRITARSAGEGDSRVKITYTPRDNDAPEEAREDAGDDTDNSPDDDDGRSSQTEAEPDESEYGDGDQ